MKNLDVSEAYPDFESLNEKLLASFEEKKERYHVFFLYLLELVDIFYAYLSPYEIRS